MIRTPEQTQRMAERIRVLISPTVNAEALKKVLYAYARDPKHCDYIFDTTKWKFMYLLSAGELPIFDCEGAPHNRAVIETRDVSTRDKFSNSMSWETVIEHADAMWEKIFINILATNNNAIVIRQNPTFYIGPPTSYNLNTYDFDVVLWTEIGTFDIDERYQHLSGHVQSLNTMRNIVEDGIRNSINGYVGVNLLSKQVEARMERWRKR